MKKILLLLSFLALIAGCSAQNAPGAQTSSWTRDTVASSRHTSALSSSTPSSGSDSSSSDAPPKVFTASFAGDCTFGRINEFAEGYYFPAVYRKSGSLTWPFDGVKDIFSKDDLTVVNFECTLTDATDTAVKDWHFRGDAQYAEIFPASSVEAVLLSNNHSGDYLDRGLADTRKALSASGTAVVLQNEPLIRDINGLRVVVIGDCSIVGENTTRTDGVAERVIAQIKRYLGNDTVIIVDMHWGCERDLLPSEWQRQTARDFIDAGADLVVGQHPHVVQGIEEYNGRFIVYSLGNFAFGGNCLAKLPETFVFQMIFTVAVDGSRRYSAAVYPCLITSSQERDANGNLRNDFRPLRLYGDDADAVADMILQRSLPLENGITDITLK